jgi:hypothetical protein
MLIVEELLELEVESRGEYDFPPARFQELPDKTNPGIWGKFASRMGVPLWGSVLIRILLVLFLAIFGSIAGLYWRLSNLEGQISRIPNAITQKLIDSSKKSVDSGNIQDASEYLQLAISFLDDARKSKTPVDTAFFGDTYVKLSQLRDVSQLAKGYQTARVQLATYRSVLQPTPRHTGNENKLRTPTTPSNLSQGTTIVLTAPGDFIISNPLSRKLSNAFGVEDITFVGGVDGVTQTLDGIQWKNVVFVNVHIRYEGAEVVLENVKFANCTFEIVNDRRGNQVTDYAILSMPPKLVVGQSATSWLNPQTSPTIPTAIAGVIRKVW